MAIASDESGSVDSTALNAPHAADERMKSAMVLFALEQSLGQYVTENTPDLESLPQTLVQTVSDRSRDASEPASVSSVIQSTYINETIDAAVAISRHASDNQHLLRLKELATSLRIYDIRNAICHPNRPFADVYWHRLAAIATDPAVEALQFRQVIAAFKAAVEGKILGPPDTWFRLRVWAINNNLPDSVDHEITGLIGRTKDSSELLKKLSNPRFPLLALVGPGGTGKTALCLDVLQNCCRNPATLEWADELLFVTAKSERLTSRGVESITDPIDSFDLLKRAIAASLVRLHDLPDDTPFSEVSRGLRDRRVLLCIDNLETVIRDYPAAFDDFYAELPTSWRVVVTSRVVVNSATVIPVDNLAGAFAKVLCRQYLAKRGGPRLEETIVEQIAESCNGTPLAIRLVVDSFLAGMELEAALKTTKENVVDFSYSGLLAALPATAHDVLECLFAANRILGRDEIGDLLSYSADQVAEGMTALIRTSLVTRHASLEQEKYSLSSSVRDLLLRDPVKPDVRRVVHDGLRSQEHALQGLAAGALDDPLAWDNVPEGLPNHVKAMAFEVCNAIRRRSSREVLLRGLDRVMQQLKREERTPLLRRLSAYLYTELHDRVSAVQVLRQAAERDGDLAASLSLAEYLLDDQKLDDAHRITSQLLNDGWGDEQRSSTASAMRVIKVHWVVSIWRGMLDEAIEASASWATEGRLRPTWACIRVSALKRVLERCADAGRASQIVDETLDVLDFVLMTDGYIGSVAHETLNALEQIAWTVERLQLHSKTAARLCHFVDVHLPAVCGVHRTRSLDDPLVIKWISAFQSLDCGEAGNILRKQKWSEELTDLNDPALAEVGYVGVTVYAPPRDARSFLFARDEEGLQYYVSRRSTALSQDEFAKIRTGDRLFVLPVPEVEEGKAIAVRDVIQNR